MRTTITRISLQELCCCFYKNCDVYNCVTMSKFLDRKHLLQQI